MAPCAALEPHSRHKLRLTSESLLSDSWAEIEHQLDSSGSTRNGRDGVGGEGRLTCLQNHETGLPGTGHWWPSACAALEPTKPTFRFCGLNDRS